MTKISNIKYQKVLKVFYLIFSLLIIHYSLFSLVYAESTDLGTLEGLPGGFAPDVSGENPEEAAAKSLTKIFSNVFGVMTVVGGLIFILYFILGGISWTTSSGEREKVEKAKKQMTNAAIGLIIVVASYSIAFIIGTVLGIDILNPADYIINVLGPQGAGSD